MRVCTLAKLLFIKLILILNVVGSEEILGCGGFIKSHADIDFSKVEVKLLTKHGSVKDVTESLSNGYYFLPVYDKGEYILKVSPPPGWSFEPEQIQVVFDGKTDICSLGKDVNFVFKGFGITGRVEVAGQNNGAKDVSIELLSEDKSDRRTTTSGPNGVFYFTPVIPGKYTIRVSKDTWYFEQAERVVIVNTGNTELAPKSFTVTGYDVQSSINIDGHESAVPIGIALYQQISSATSTKSGCSSTSPAMPDVKSGHSQYAATAICFTEVAQRGGQFRLNGVASGRYLLRPVVLDKSVRLHIQPEFVEIDVHKDSVSHSNLFDVTGFSIGGRVLTTAAGFGIGDAVVRLNGKEVTRTHSDGTYTLANIRPGTYTVQVSADRVQFNDQVVKVSFADAALPDIVAAAFQVCGTVVSQKSYTVALTKHSSTFHTQATSKGGASGEWCVFLPNGRFSVEVLTQAEEKELGVQFFPLQQNIEVNASPLSGVVFSQLRAKITGSIRCMTDVDNTCKDIDVTLLSLDSNGKQTGQRLTAQLQANDKYSFDDVLPGLYEVNVPSLYLCWEAASHNINVKTAEYTVPPFVHTGYLVSIISSHPTKMKLALKEENADVTDVHQKDLLAGLNSFCVNKFGQYMVDFIGCHTYDARELPSSIKIADHAPITVNAIKHRTAIQILSAVPAKFGLDITGGGGGSADDEANEKIQLSVAEAEKVNGMYSYRYSFSLRPEERVTLRPYSEEMLFHPQSADVVGENDCVDTAYTFTASQGLIINGKILPAIEGATIRLTFAKSSALMPLTTTSNANGQFKFGPLDSGVSYELSAEKESYVFAEYDMVTQTFKAHKLCEIIAIVKDEQGKQLPGVLLSLSGSESYRKNLITGEDGTHKFHSLSPSQYYLRPMMKEYRFEPSSKIIDVTDGKTVTVTLHGKRVAYSVMGNVRTLNGEPFGNAIIETSAEEPCSHHQEEAITEPNGIYRIRGLQPGCEYTVRIMSGATEVERTIPTTHRIAIDHDDQTNVNFIAIAPIGFVDVTAHLFAATNEHYKSLRVQLYRKGNADSPIYSQRVEAPLKARSNSGLLVFFPRIPYDGQTYYVELTTTLSDKNYRYELPVQSFVSNRSSVFVELSFMPEPRSTDGDLNQNSLSALLLICVFAIVFFKQDLAFDFFNFLWTHVINSVEQVLNSGGRRRGQTGSSAKQQQQYDATAFNENEIDKLANSINSIKKKSVRKT